MNSNTPLVAAAIVVAAILLMAGTTIAFKGSIHF